MRKLFAALCLVSLFTFFTEGSVVPLSMANGGGIGAAGGGGGLIPMPDDPPFDFVTAPGALTLPVSGKVPGAANGSLKLIFTLLEQDFELFSETRTVTISAEKFSMRFGAGTTSGLPASLLAGTTRAEIRWARETAPNTVLGTLQLAAAPYAMTLSPGAQLKSSSAFPALTVSNASTGVKATASGVNGRGLLGESTSGASASYGVEGRAMSVTGAGGSFINSSGDLIVGRNAVDGPVKFRVANNGDVFVRGVKVGQQGPKGDTGAQGARGAKGDTGETGPKGDTGPGAAATFCIDRSGNSCLGVCTNGSALVAQAASPCAASNGCSYGSTGHVCCVCTSTH